MLQSISQAITHVRDLCQNSIRFATELLTRRDDEMLLSNLRGEAFSAYSVYQHARRTLETGHSAHTELQSLPQIKAASERVYKPIFALALQGDEHMRDEYQKGRIAQLSYLPSWVTSDCKKLVKGFYEGFEVHKHVAGGRRHSNLNIILRPVDDHVFSTVFINYLVTINEMRNFCREVREHHYAKGRIQELKTLSFNPASQCPLGNAARGALTKCVELITAARIVTDMGMIFDIELPEQTTRALVRTHLLNPWGVTSDPIFKRMFEVNDILTSHDTQISPNERRDLLLRCITGLPAMGPYTPAHHQQLNSETKHQSKPLQAATAVTQGSFLRNVVVDAIQSKIATRDHATSRALARELYKAIQRRDLVLPDVMTALSRGLTAEELLSQAAQREEMSSVMVAEDPRPIASCHEVETRVENREDRSPKTRIELTPAAKAWLENLNDKETRDRIHRRLERLKVGNFGNFKMVRGGVYELREGRYRIYFKKLSEEQVKVLKLGDKHSQDQDIEACQSL